MGGGVVFFFIFLLTHIETLVKYPFPARKVPTYWWRSATNKRSYLDHVKQQLGGSLNNLYEIRKIDLVSTGGSSLLASNSWSPSLAVMTTYPEHPWKPWKFHRSPNNWWKQTGAKFASGDEEAAKLVREYIEDLGKQLNLSLSRPNEWKTVATSKLDRATQVQLDQLGGLQKVLARLVQLDSVGQHRSKLAEQTHLQTHVNKLLPSWRKARRGKIRVRCDRPFLQFSHKILKSCDAALPFESVYRPFCHYNPQL